MMSPRKPKFVFLHALPFGAQMWGSQIDAFVGKSIAPDLYGCGSDLMAWAKHALAQASGDKLIIVGNSVGGSCALEMASIAPDRVAALVLVGTKAERRVDSALREECVTLLQTRGFDAAWDKYWAPLFGPNTSAQLLATARELAAQTSIEHIANGVEAFHTRPSRFELLGQLDCPIVCVTGEHDIAPGKTVTRAQAAAAQLGEYIEVPDCGHYVPLECSDAMTSILDDVLKRVT